MKFVWVLDQTNENKILENSLNTVNVNVNEAIVGFLAVTLEAKCFLNLRFRSNFCISFDFTNNNEVRILGDWGSPSSK